MTKRASFIAPAILLAAIISACNGSASAATPAIVRAEDAQSTAIAGAFTVVAETHIAIPTNTFAPPTETFTEAPPPTNTLELSPTVDAPLPTFTASPTDAPTLAPSPTAVSAANCNQPLTKWQGPSASFTVANETKPKGKIILMMSVLTKSGECGWLHIYSDSFSGPVGSYSAGAFVEGPKDFRVFGAFNIAEGGWKVVVRNDVIIAKGSCYPNC